MIALLIFSANIMKINKSLIFLFILLFTQLGFVKAQENITQLLSGSISDAQTLSNAYLEPFVKGLGYSLNDGWYNSAKPHKIFGFDMTFTMVSSIPPQSAEKFDVSKLKLDYWEPQSQTSVMSPTVTGEKESGPILQQKGNPAITMTLPKGVGLKYIPAPIMQMGLGLPFNTELVGRFLPEIQIQDVGKFSLWGVGIKNEFKEFIPGLKSLPFDISVFFGYTKLKSSFDIDATKPASSQKNQLLTFDASGYTGKLLISKSILILTVYAGAGYSSSRTNVALKGDYTVENLGDKTDPINLDFNNNGLNANIGLRMKLNIIAFHFDYTFGNYRLYNAGVGINFR